MNFVVYLNETFLHFKKTRNLPLFSEGLDFEAWRLKQTLLNRRITVSHSGDVIRLIGSDHETLHAFYM